MPRKPPPAIHQFKKGKSGNPKGRPKKIPEIDELLADVMGEKQKGVSAAKAILQTLRMITLSNNYSAAHRIRAAEVLLDRAYGKAKQTVEAEGELDLNLKGGVVIGLPPVKGDGKG